MVRAVASLACIILPSVDCLVLATCVQGRRNTWFCAVRTTDIVLCSYADVGSETADSSCGSKQHRSKLFCV